MIPVSKPLISTTDLTFATFFAAALLLGFLGGVDLSRKLGGAFFSSPLFRTGVEEEKKKSAVHTNHTQVNARFHAFVWFTTTT